MGLIIHNVVLLNKPDELSKSFCFYTISSQSAATTSSNSSHSSDDTSSDSEETEIPKALGDIVESVAGAIYLDSGLSLDAVWGVYYPIMKPKIGKYQS